MLSKFSLKISSIISLEILNSLKSRNEKFLQVITEKIQTGNKILQKIECIKSQIK